MPHKFSPSKLIRVENEELKNLNNEKTSERLKPRQNIPRLYARNGPAILIFKTDYIKKTKPENYSKFVVNAGGRYFPVYPALTNDPFWQSRPVFKELIKTVNVGHTLYYPGKLTKAMGEVVMNTTVQKQLQSMLVDGKSPANAVADAQEDMVNIYRRNGEPV